MFILISKVSTVLNLKIRTGARYKMEEQFNIENQFSFCKQKSNEVFKKALEDLKNEYETKDWEIFHSKWRKSHGYIPHRTRKRTITTIFGNLTYSHHRYRHWDNYKYKFVYLSDLALGIEKYQRITNHLTVKILNLIAEGKRYQDILDCFPNVKFHCRTISNIISRTKINSLQDVMATTKIPKVKIEKCLYINVDDTFLTLKVKNQKKKFRIRVVLFDTGYDAVKSTNKKKVLKNVRFFAYLVRQNSTIETQDFMNKVYDLANSFYTNIDNVNVIISGDGAPWIRQCNTICWRQIFWLNEFTKSKMIHWSC